MKQDSLKKRIFALIVGLVINALGSGLTVSTNVGTNPWTAAELNLCPIIKLDIGWTMFLVGILVIIANQLLIRRFDWLRLVGEFIFISCFSYFIDLFVDMFNKLGVPHFPFYLRTILCLIGVVVFSCAIFFISEPISSCIPTMTRPTSCAFYTCAIMLSGRNLLTLWFRLPFA